MLKGGNKYATGEGIKFSKCRTGTVMASTGYVEQAMCLYLYMCVYGVQSGKSKIKVFPVPGSNRLASCVLCLVSKAEKFH